jgi:hypothetical protein
MAKAATDDRLRLVRLVYVLSHVAFTYRKLVDRLSWLHEAIPCTFINERGVAKF